MRRAAIHGVLSILALASLARAQARQAEPTALVRGTVVDAQTSEPLRGVLVTWREGRRETLTDGAGAFVLGGLSAGSVRLHLGTVGYGVVEKVLVLRPGEQSVAQVALYPEALKRSESVTVRAGAFAAAESATTAYDLTAGELKNLASVFADDPLRAVQALPGVATGDDFHATFAARGFGFPSVGLYIDGMLTTAPFHTIRNDDDMGSLTILSGDVVDSITLMSGGAPVAYGDRIGPALSVHTREGGDRLAGRVNLSLAGGLSALFEGPWGRSRRGSWLVSVRKSYLDYLVRQVADDAPLLSFYDVQSKLSYRPFAAHRLSVFGLYGDFDSKDRDVVRPYLFTQVLAQSGTKLAKLEWQWFFGRRGSLTTSAFASAETGTGSNDRGDPLERQAAGQVGVRSDLAYEIAASHRLEAGFQHRRIADERESYQTTLGKLPFVLMNAYDSSSGQPSGFVQDTWTAPGGHLVVTAGLRADRLGATGETLWLPRAGATLTFGGTALTANAGEYGQFPSFLQRVGPGGEATLRAERSRQMGLAIDQRLGERTRVRVELYDQQIRKGLSTRLRETRLMDGYVVPADAEGRLQNAIHGHSRGFEVLVQRRSANRLSGWLSYAYGSSRLRDAHGESPGELRPFAADFDQKHTVNLYASGRFSRSFSVSGKLRYGSGFPLAGYYRQTPTRVELAEERNRVRQDSYRRCDVRVNKAFGLRDWKLTLYAEVMNVFDSHNVRLRRIDENYATREAEPVTRELFPILPAVGLTLEF